LPLDGETVAKILIVEDSPDSMKLVPNPPDPTGSRGDLTAGWGRVAGDIERASPELVLMDIRLPGKDGFALLSEIR
jgi:DNA-binding response OmpR family regulator